MTLDDIAETLERIAKADLELASAFRIAGKYSAAREYQDQGEAYARAAEVLRRRESRGERP